MFLAEALDWPSGYGRTASASSSPTVASTSCTSATSAISRPPARSRRALRRHQRRRGGGAAEGRGAPLMPARERAEVLAALRAVDHVVVFDEDTADALVAAVRPAIHAKGTDYTRIACRARHGARHGGRSSSSVTRRTRDARRHPDDRGAVRACPVSARRRLVKLSSLGDVIHALPWPRRSRPPFPGRGWPGSSSGGRRRCCAIIRRSTR